MRTGFRSIRGLQPTPADVAIRTQWLAWVAVCAAVLERDIQNGKASENPDAPELESPLLRACMDTRDVLEGIVHRGGHWRGAWTFGETFGRRRSAVARG